MYDGRLLKLYNMSDDFEFLSVSNRIHQQKKEKKNLSISALIALETPPSFILLLAWYAAIGQQIHEKLQTASYSTEKFFYSCIINDLCQKIHESNTFSSDFFFNFHPIYKFKSWNGYYFHFFEMFIFFFKTVSPWYSMELSYPVFVSCVAQKVHLKTVYIEALLYIFEFHKFLIFRPCQAIIFFESLRNHHDNLLYKSPQNFWCWISKFHQTNH